MGMEKRALTIHETLKSLCVNNGWSYCVLWSFDERNSMLLTMEDAYYEEQMAGYIDNMLLHVHMLGNGVVGETAFAKTHQWLLAEEYRRDMNPFGSIGNDDISKDDSEIHSQFSSGIETITLISVEPHGVVQFGSTRKIFETMQFVDQTKSIFREIQNCDVITLPSSSSRESYDLNNLFASSTSYSFSGNFDMMNNNTSICNNPSADFQYAYPLSSHTNNHFIIANEDILPNTTYANTPSEFLIDIPTSFPSTSMQSSLTDNTFDPDGDLIMFNNNHSNIQNGMFDNLGADFEFGGVENLFDDILVPVVNNGELDFSTEVISESISKQQNVGSVFSPRETLFSKLGIDQNLDDRTSKSYSFGGSCSGTKVSSGIEKKRKISDIQSCGSNSFVSQPKISEESVRKTVKKRAKSGSRPKPKDRQQIQDRIAELRKLIPNGLKMSIDSLLAQTIKHMIFLEGVTKHAENLKKAEARKEIEATLREIQSMVDPVNVRDLSLPGQKQIHMLCEERGFFHEIVDIIQGLGLIILKGIIEVREDKIWACFTVESEAKRHISKQEIYLSLHQLLYQKGSNEINVYDGIADNGMKGGNTLFDNNQHVQLPINFSYGLL